MEPENSLDFFINEFTEILFTLLAIVNRRAIQVVKNLHFRIVTFLVTIGGTGRGSLPV